MFRHHPGSTLFPYTTLFRSRLPPPVLEVGWFAETLRHTPCPAIALLHVDCDLYEGALDALNGVQPALQDGTMVLRSEEHTSELQSLRHLVCRLLLEKKKNDN